MDLKVVPSRIRGSIAVIGSKSHTIRGITAALLAEDPLLTAPDHALLAAQVEQMFEKAGAMN